MNGIETFLANPDDGIVAFNAFYRQTTRNIDRADFDQVNVILRETFEELGGDFTSGVVPTKS